jgi:hypothetical protein
MEKRYPSDLTDELWDIIKSLIPDAKPGGRPRSIDLPVLWFLQFPDCSNKLFLSMSTIQQLSHPRLNCKKNDGFTDLDSQTDL